MVTGTTTPLSITLRADMRMTTPVTRTPRFPARRDTRKLTAPAITGTIMRKETGTRTGTRTGMGTRRRSG